jgi:Domain of unknown function (DUF4349)
MKPTDITRGRLAAFAAVVVLGGVACSSSAAPQVMSPASTSAGAKAAPPPVSAAQSVGGAAIAPGAPPAAAPAADAAARSASAGNAGAAASTVTDQSFAESLDRMVIRSSQLTVEVADMEPALAQARQIASRGGGFVSASNTHLEKVNDQDRMVADLTIQVRSDSADAALTDLRALGKVTSEASGSQDVTEEYVDLGSNLRNLQASEAAILKLMDKATQIQDVLSLQRELTNVRGQIERIQGRKTYLERRSDMATITLALRLPAAETPKALSGAWDPIGVAQRGWQASLAVLRTGAELLIVIAAFSWWMIPFALLGGYIVLQRRRRTPGPTAPAAPVEA